MPKIDLGTVGAVLPGYDHAFVDTAVELEEMGYQTLWLRAGSLPSLGQIADVVRATKRARIASGIISVDRFGAGEVSALYAELRESGRFVVGLGGAHGPYPLRTLNAYLDNLDQDDRVPATARLLAALGPKMLELARSRSAGAFPVLVTPGYTARARTQIGPHSTLAVEQMVVIGTDPAYARGIARGPIEFLNANPAYPASYRRMGFTGHEIAGLSDRLVDALVPWGTPDAVAAAISSQLRAGADHVAVSLRDDPTRPHDPVKWRELAQRLLPG